MAPKTASEPSVIEWAPAPTPTGLSRSDLEQFSDDEALALARWHAGVAGDQAVGFWPQAIRRMPPQGRLRLALDPRQDEAWKARERFRCQEDPHYFIASYGSLLTEEGQPIPFELWDEQREVLVTFHGERKVIVLKARQLGLTWLALHYALWLIAFNPKTPRARVLALSKNGGDANLLVERIRAVKDYLPPYLRPVEKRETRDSKNAFAIEGRGRLRSLTSKPAAARMETATLVIADEFAFVENGKAPGVWTAVKSTIGAKGKIFVISTGNGPEEVKGDGQAFAQLWKKARTGEEDLVAVFLPTSTHPDRDEEWRETEKKEYLADEDFEAEHPETEEEALQGKSGTKVYLPKGINRAEMLGRMVFDPLLHAQRYGELAEIAVAGWEGLTEIPEPTDGVIHTGADFGEFTGILAGWPLEGGGIYVPPSEVYSEGDEVGIVTDRLMERLAALQTEDDEAGLPWPPIYHARYDAAGVQSQRTFRRTVQENPDYFRRFEAKRVGRSVKIRSYPVAFGKWKDDAKDYLRHLFRRTAQGETVRIIAISPENKVLLRQLRGLELDDDGKIVKGDDHMPDALIALAAPIARKYHGRRGKKGASSDRDPGDDGME